MAMDIYKGWPFDGALNDNAKPKLDEGIIAGMAIKKDTNGELIKADGTPGENAFFALENQADYSVQAAGKMAYIVSNAIVLTDQYDNLVEYPYQAPVQADPANPGKFKPWVTADPDPDPPIYAKADGFVTRDDIQYLKLIKVD